MTTSLRILFSVIGIISLAVCVTTPILSFVGKISFDGYLLWFNIATLVWFITAPFWMIRKKSKST
jgi:hypothetical protein